MKDPRLEPVMDDPRMLLPQPMMSLLPPVMMNDPHFSLDKLEVEPKHGK